MRKYDWICKKNHMAQLIFQNYHKCLVTVHFFSAIACLVSIFIFRRFNNIFEVVLFSKIPLKISVSTVPLLDMRYCYHKHIM